MDEFFPCGCHWAQEGNKHKMVRCVEGQRLFDEIAKAKGQAGKDEAERAYFGHTGRPVSPKF